MPDFKVSIVATQSCFVQDQFILSTQTSLSIFADGINILNFDTSSLISTSADFTSYCLLTAIIESI